MVNIMVKPIRMNHLIDLLEAKKLPICLLFFSKFIWDLLFMNKAIQKGSETFEN